MSILLIISLAALAFCFAMLLHHFIRIVRLGKPSDFSRPSGSVSKGVVYANTTAMMPSNKESAYMHLPTYTLGIVYHIGTFLSLLSYLAFAIFFVVLLCSDEKTAFVKLLSAYMFCENYSWLLIVIGCFLAISTCSGIALIIKRIANKNLHNLTNPDDYLSNAFTTLFQLSSCLMFFFPFHDVVMPIHLIAATILFIYMPFGKLKHVLYYFSARYHLGFFYGRRNVWPPRKSEE